MSPERSVSPLERAVIYSRVRGELGREHRRLTERQLDRITELVVELRLARIRLGLEGSGLVPSKSG